LAQEAQTLLGDEHFKSFRNNEEYELYRSSRHAIWRSRCGNACLWPTWTINNVYWR